jgi:hypothetical protein
LHGVLSLVVATNWMATVKSYNIICPGFDERNTTCRNRYFDPKGDQKGNIDIKRCLFCEDGIGDPERRYDQKAYRRNKAADRARRAKLFARPIRD